MLFAALEAARLSGWEATCAAAADIVDEVSKVARLSAADDAKDDDGDGVADVDQIDGADLLLRKTKLVLTKVDPGKLNVAVGGLYTAWLGVVATLKVRFARTVTLALTIADFLERPATRFLDPALRHVVPDEYELWVPVVLKWACKSAGMSVAWYIQAVISAVSSGIRGGLLFARSMMAFAVGRGVTLGGLIPEDDADTMLDEYVGYVLAACGVYFQVFLINFSVPWYLNIVLWPFGVANEYIKWAVTSN